MAAGREVACGSVRSSGPGRKATSCAALRRVARDGSRGGHGRSYHGGMSCTPAFDPAAADFTHIDPRAVALLSERWARRHAVLPLTFEAGRLVVATSNPLDLDAEQAVAFATGHAVRWAIASPAEVARQIDRCYADAGARREQAAPPVAVEHLRFGTEGDGGVSAEQGGSVMRLVDQLIAEGIGAGASDIHLEPEEHAIAVRHRVDGVLRQVRTLPRAIAPSLVSRVKILSGLDIADRLRPQDGRARVAVTGAVVDLRISTLPASHGEKIVIRVLDGSAGLRNLDAIGFRAGELARIRSLLEQREGLLLVTGPTGSGKTTTLYAALREIQARGVNVVTVEDPIEYRLPGIVQVQVHERAGLTFGAALRSIMRQDPDVILVGEIRDRETAEIAIQASLTGHLVLSTLHTNDAASAVTRLMDIGVPAYQIATAVRGVVAQRLVRRSCPDCTATGCPACEESGYRGRIAIAEILVASPELGRRIAAGASCDALAEAAREGGSLSLWESGQELVRSGRTTMDELRRVAAEPVRMVAERRLADIADAGERGDERPPALADEPIRIQWRGSPADRILVELRAAADMLAEHVELRQADAARATGAADVVITGALQASVARHSPSSGAAGPLMIALAHDGAAGDHVRLLARDADLVLPATIHGRTLLATILALLRWRGR